MATFGTRLDRAARALEPYGFAFDETRATELRAYEPFLYFANPDAYVTAAFGSIDGAAVEVFEYEYATVDGEGGRTMYRNLVVAVHHPWVNGGAAFGPDHELKTAVRSILDMLAWIPPFTILKLIELFTQSSIPDRRVGDAAFDRFYRVVAASDAEARRAISPALREICIRMGFQGCVELRPGVLLYIPHPFYSFDEETIVAAVGMATAFLSVFTPQSGHPMR